MNVTRHVQAEIVQADFQQALEAFAEGRDDIAIAHAEAGTQKLREFSEQSRARQQAVATTQLTIDINPQAL